VVIKHRNFKMEWAKIHLDALNAHFSGLISNPEKIYTVTIEEDTKRGLLHIKGEATGQIEIIKLGLFAGDFICNLRASLDHLAWDLAGRRGSREIHFPVFGEDCPDTQTKIAAATAGMPCQAVSIMKSLQPYKRGKAYKSHPLWRLNFLWNADKHRILALHTADSGVLFEIEPRIPFKERKFDDKTIVDIPLSAKDKVRLNPRPNIKITFGDEQRGVELTIQDLRDIYEFVSLEVMPPLMGFLP